MSIRRRIYIIAAVFTVLLGSGVIYAAWMGVLNLTGTAELNQSVRLSITDESVTDRRTGDSIAVSTPDGETMTFSVELDAPNDMRYVTFKIQNVGNLPAVLGPPDTSNPDAATGVAVDWPGDLEDMVIMPGATSDEQTITVHWDPVYAGSTEQTVYLSITINYEQNMPDS